MRDAPQTESTQPLPAPHPQAHLMHSIDGRHRPGHQQSELATETVLPFNGDAKHAARESTNAGCRPGARLSIDLVDTSHRFSSEVVVRTTVGLARAILMAPMLAKKNRLKTKAVMQVTSRMN